MALLTAATRPAVGGGPSASDSGDCGIEDPKLRVVFFAHNDLIPIQMQKL